MRAWTDQLRPVNPGRAILTLWYGWFQRAIRSRGLDRGRRARSSNDRGLQVFDYGSGRAECLVAFGEAIVDHHDRRRDDVLAEPEEAKDDRGPAVLRDD